MGTAKAAAIMPFLVKDPYQVNNHIAPCQGLRQGVEVVDVAFHQLKCGQYEEIPVGFTPTCKHA